MQMENVGFINYYGFHLTRQFFILCDGGFIQTQRQEHLSDEKCNK